MLQLDRLHAAVQHDAAIRRLRRLQPVGGQGDKIFPPTYPPERRGDPPRHVFEFRRIAGQNVLCVLIDSVQSQANRLEEALRQARDTKRISLPSIVVDFTKTELKDIGTVSALDAPHRVFDAIIRDSELGGKRFKDTEHGKRLIEAKVQNAAAVFQLAPSALIFGAWNSTGEGGGLGAKFPRCVVSEIIGVGVATEPGRADQEPKPSGQRTGSRIDPLGIRSAIKVYKTPDGDWALTPSGKGAEEVKPSAVNHSNIAPTVTPLGVSLDYALHSFVVSCAALRRLRFPAQGDGPTEADAAAHAALAALALAAALFQDEAGYFLRSRCDLVPEPGGATWEIVRADGQSEPFEIDAAGAAQLVHEAAQAAKRNGMAWNADDLVLTPQKKLVDLVLKSREKALAGVDEAESGQ